MEIECVVGSLEKKSLNIPQSGGKMSKTCSWDHRLQRQNLLWHLNGFPDGSDIGSTVVVHSHIQHIVLATEETMVTPASQP